MGEIIIGINNNNYIDVTCKLTDEIEKVHGKSKVEEADKQPEKLRTQHVVEKEK